jgi:FkbM family methyltransferase
MGQQHPSWRPVRRFTHARTVLAHAGRFVPVERVRDRPAGLARTALLRLANAYLARSPRTFGPTTLPCGVRISGCTDDMIQRHVYVFGSWEPALSDWVQQQLRPGDVFLDFGANIGYFSLLAAHVVGPSGRVIAFEPVPSILAQMRANVAANGYANIDVQPVVASDVEAELEVFRGPMANSGTSGTEEVAGGRSEGRVRSVVAADAVPRDLWARVRLVKIDVEGDEMRVLRGLAPLLDALPPAAAVVVEVAPGRLQSRGDSAEALMSFMTSRGFSSAVLDNNYSAGFYANPRPVHPVAVTAAPSEQVDMIFAKG